MCTVRICYYACGVLVEAKDVSNSKDVKQSVEQPVKGNQLL